MKRSFSFQWHLTTRCQQRCKHCYIFNSSQGQVETYGEKDINKEKLDKIAKDIVATSQRFEANCRVALTGGDPLLHPHFWDILSYLRSENVEVEVLGNPWLVNDAVARRLSNIGIYYYQLSIDGVRERHDKWRKGGSFDATVNAIRVLQRHDINTAVMMTISKENAADLPRVIELVADELRVSMFAFARYVPTHGDVGSMFDPFEYRSLLDATWKMYQPRAGGKTQLSFKDHLWTLYLAEEGLFKPQATDDMVVAGCGLGVSHMTILANGEVYGCRRFPSPVGKVPERSLADTYFSEQMQEYREVGTIEKCASCFLKCFCRGCRAVAAGFSGDWRKPDPQCWR